MSPASALFLLTRAQIQNDPGFIVGPISRLFGYIIDFIFNLVYTVSVNNSLGISIIFMTVIVRCLMLPLAVKQQQSMLKMQKLNPDVAKIRSKYGTSKDPEVQQKMNVEIQALYSKHKVNPLSGCLPMLITMPLFFGMYYIMNQSFMFITKLGELYRELAIAIYIGIGVDGKLDALVRGLAVPHIPQKMLDEGAISLSVPSQFAKVLNKFGSDDWGALFAQMPGEYLPRIQRAFEQKLEIENFLGLPLIDVSGWMWPGILIPVLACLTTLMSSWLSMAASPSTGDDRTKTTQRMMMIVMPLMMGFMTVSMPAGVGLYWITSSTFQVAQQLVMNKRAGIPIKIPFLKPKNSE